MLDIEERFQGKVSLPNQYGCKLWVDGTNSEGYGLFSINRHPVYAHRFAYMRKYGEIPKGVLICHTCERFYPKDSIMCRRCVSDEHLYAGTIAQNNYDKIATGRSRNQYT